MESYNYVKGNLIDQPNTYFYSTFFGYDFFISWKKQRKALYDKMGGEMDAPKSNHLCDFEEIEKILCAESISTDKLFEGVFGNLDKNSVKMLIVISKLIKKFEVSKRWYSTYLSGLRTIKESGDFHNFELYVRAAEIFETVYVKLDHLPSLNVFLKLIDTLCSIAEELDVKQKMRLARLIKSEALFIEKIGYKYNIKL